MDRPVVRLKAKAFRGILITNETLRFDKTAAAHGALEPSLCLHAHATLVRLAFATTLASQQRILRSLHICLDLKTDFAETIRNFLLLLFDDLLRLNVVVIIVILFPLGHKSKRLLLCLIFLFSDLFEQLGFFWLANYLF